MWGEEEEDMSLVLGLGFAKKKKDQKNSGDVYEEVESLFCLAGVTGERQKSSFKVYIRR